MIAVWLEDGLVEVRDVPPPVPVVGEALVRVTAAGICGTDLELRRGYGSFGGIPGHEFVGVVEDGPGEWLGARVVAEINVTCRSYPDTRTPCGRCAAGRANHCDERDVIGIRGRSGAFAEFVALPVANLHRVPEKISDEEATFIEPLAAAFRVLEQVAIGRDTRVVVIGPGRLGRLVARVLETTGCSLTIAGRSSHIEPGRADVAVDCTGEPAGFVSGLEALRPEGTLVLKSTYAEHIELEASPIVVEEIRIVGSRCGPFGPAIEALEAGSIEVLDLVDDRMPLSRAPEAFDRAAEPGVAKVLLSP